MQVGDQTISKRPNSIDVAVGQRLADRRTALGMNQSSLAKALGITFQQIQKYETGTNRIAVSRLWAIAKALDVNVAYFFDDQSVEDAGLVTRPFSRTAREIARLVTDLPSDDQRLVLSVVRKIAVAQDDLGGSAACASSGGEEG